MDDETSRRPWKILFLVLCTAICLTSAAHAQQQSLRTAPFLVVAQHEPGERAPANSVLDEGPALASQPAATQDSPIRLAPPSDPLKRDDQPAPQSPARAITTVLGSLGVVLGLFLLIAWLTKRMLPKGSATLPQEVVEVLGRAPLAARQQMHLVRLGRKLLLLAVAPHGVETLTEVTDPAEVDHLLALCQQARPASISASFRSVLSQLDRDDRPGATR